MKFHSSDARTSGISFQIAQDMSERLAQVPRLECIAAVVEPVERYYRLQKEKEGDSMCIKETFFENVFLASLKKMRHD